LSGFRAATYNDFVTTLAGSQRDARTRMILGLSLGLMNLGFMAVLVYFIRNNMKMMAVIARQNATLEQRVAERTAQLSQKTSDINAMLQNMQMGVCTVVPGNRIHPEYSKFLGTLFGQEQMADQELVATMFTNSNLGVDAKDQISVSLGSILAEDAMMFDMNGHLLPREMEIGAQPGARKVVQMDWSPIVNEAGTIDKVLLITQDVTQLRELERSAADRQEELNIISNILRISIGKFNDFVHSAQNYLQANRKLLTETAGRDPEVIAALFRNMHTVKGNARTFQFTEITNAAHSAEQSYDRLRKDPEAVWNAGELLAELSLVEAALARYVSINEDKLGRKGRASDLLTTRGVFVGNDKLAELRELGKALDGPLAPEQATRMRTAIELLGLIPLERIVSGSVDSISSLAHELGKPAPAVDLADDAIAFNSAFSEALKGCLVHIVRNSLDHGIEMPDERVRAGKKEQGRLHIACRRAADKVEMRISDDGRGLPLHKLLAKGVSAGVLKDTDRPSRQEIAELIFLSGLSTSGQVTQVSGRGVGMDAVRTFLKEQGAGIRIALAEAEPATALDYSPFEFVIDIPSSACEHSV
jgi:HPt (histidine-containing phosphotransfer) domain-containing protein